MDKKKSVYFLLFILLCVIIINLNNTKANDNLDDKDYFVFDEFVYGNEAVNSYVPDTNYISNNPIKEVLNAKNVYPIDFDLRKLIPKNTTRMLQKGSFLCWDFTTLDMLETTLALNDYYNKNGPEIVYDFSEINAAYALTTNYFLNNMINRNGLNRNPNLGGSGALGIDLITSIGVVNEDYMKFDDWYDSLIKNEKIDIDYINNRKISAQVLDTVDFPIYSNAATTLSSDEFQTLNNRVKNHLMNYGGLYLSMDFTPNVTVNSATSAIYCSNVSKCKTNHSLTIIGWDDNYSKENFLSSSQPKNDGAWIVNNSMGYGSVDLNGLREEVRSYFCKITRNKEQCDQKGWTKNPSLITNDAIDETLVINRYIIDYENNTATHNDNGIYYISYEDAFIYSGLKGIIKATNSLMYDELYQHNIAANLEKEFQTNSENKIYISDVFKRNNLNKKEFLSSVSMYAAETNTVKVYVNPNGDSLDIDKLKLVKLKSGDSETFNAGYHTLEFSELIELTGEEFAVVLEIEGTRDNKVLLKLEGRKDGGNYSNLHLNGVDGDGFYSVNFDDWVSFSDYDLGSNYKGVDTTIKAFTVSDIVKLEISSKPSKLDYFEGDNFEVDGMMVKAVYNDGNKIVINDYELENNINLKLDNNYVIVKYQGFSVNLNINVEKNLVERLEIQGDIKNVYTEGDDFDSSNLSVFAIYKNGDKVEINDYELINALNLKLNQTEVIIDYKDVDYKISIVVNKKEEPKIVLENIEIKKMPSKVEYKDNEDLDLSGGIITAIYSNDSRNDIEMTNEEIKIDGYVKGKLGIQEITLMYENMKLVFEINVVESFIIDNSIFDNVIGNIKKIDFFTYTNNQKKEYMILETEILDIKKSNSNLSKYYYYLSSNQNIENENIDNWVEIDNHKNNNSDILLKINTLNFSSNELLKSDSLYIYIKEVTEVNSKIYEVYSGAILLKDTSVINEYVDDKLKEKEEIIDKNDNMNSNESQKPNNNTNNNTNDNTNDNNNIDENGTNSNNDVNNENNNENTDDNINNNDIQGTNTNTNTNTNSDEKINGSDNNSLKNILIILSIFVFFVLGYLLYKGRLRN